MNRGQALSLNMRINKESRARPGSGDLSPPPTGQDPQDVRPSTLTRGGVDTWSHVTAGPDLGMLGSWVWGLGRGDPGVCS